jgi:HTH-type transcriptional regulator, competence development regulator
VPPRRFRVLKRLREEKGLSQADLAEKAGVTAPYITQLETGKKANPSLDVLRRLAKALGVPVAELLE